MYFLGYDIDEETPNHSVLSKARRRFGAKIFEEFFEHILAQCKSKGLIQDEKTFIDSTLIPANASLSSVVDCDQKVVLKRTPAEYLKKVEEDNPLDDKDNPLKKDKPDPQAPKLPKNKVSYSKTDPDASIIKRKNKPTQLAYKQHISVDSGKAKIITACSTTPANIADEHKLPHLISKTHEKHKILPKEVGADGKYGTADNYRFLLENNIKPSISHHGDKNTTGLWKKSKFVYNKEKDQYKCPKGHILKNSSLMKKERHIIYRARAKHCKACKYRKHCTNSSQGRSVIRHVHESALERAKKHLESIQAKLTIEERSRVVETVFASEKKDLGLKRAKFRGLPNVSIQSLLTATAYNLKKLVKYAGDSTQKLKEAVKLPILPDLKKKATETGQIIRNSNPANVMFSIKELVFSFFRLNLVFIPA